MTEKANATDNPGKIQDIFKRRLQSGKCYHTPYFGTRECPVYFEPCEENTIKTAYEDIDDKDLGFMLYDFDYSNKEECIEALKELQDTRDELKKTNIRFDDGLQLSRRGICNIEDMVTELWIEVEVKQL